MGKGEAEGRALIEELLAHATQPCFVHRHRWRAGDLVVYVQPLLLGASGLCAETVGRLVRKVFRESARVVCRYDNLAVLHRSRPWDGERYKRVLHLVALSGRPLAVEPAAGGRPPPRL